MSKSASKPDKVQPQFFKFDHEPIRGFPELHWAGKRPFRSTNYYPAQRAEVFGEPVNGWMNKIFWGDNLHVMSHLLREFRGKVQLIYIDPPFDSGADYKKSISLRGKRVQNDHSAFEEKQYADIWNNDGYLQFIFDRLFLLKELLSDTGLIFLHCDWHRSHHIRSILEEVFGPQNFRNEIVWVRSTNPKGSQHESSSFSVFTDSILVFAKSYLAPLYIDRVRIPLSSAELLVKYDRIDDKGRFSDGPIVSSDSMGPRPTLVYEYKGYTPPPSGWRVKKEKLIEIDKSGDLGWTSNNNPYRKLRPENDKGKPIGSFWNDISLLNSQSDERVGYPTQKPEALLNRIIRVGSNPGDLVFDAFMGSGTTQAVAMRLGRKFIGADINLGAIETTKKRLLSLVQEIADTPPKLAFMDPTPPKLADDEEESEVITNIEKTNTFYNSFEYYVVNNYDVFRNEVEAREILLDALEVTRATRGIFDGEMDGWMVKLLSPNRIATREDLNEIVTKFDYKTYLPKQKEHPNKPVEKIRLICMGHEPGLGAFLEQEMYRNQLIVKVEVLDVLRDRTDLEFKQESVAEIDRLKSEVVIRKFYPMNLLKKLSMQKTSVSDWRELVQSVLIDFYYNGQELRPQVVDVPETDELVQGRYSVPADARRIAVKITDLLDESLLIEVSNGKK